MLDWQAQVALAQVVAYVGSHALLHGPQWVLEARSWGKSRTTSILVQSCAFITPLVFPPRAQRSPPGHPPKRTMALLKSIKILIIFGHRFWIDFGSFWGAILGSFLALLEAKMRQVRSKTRLESSSTSKT